MDFRLVIIGAFFVILLVAMGENPLDELRKEAAKDPLQESIKEHWEKQEQPFAAGGQYGNLFKLQGQNSSYYTNGNTNPNGSFANDNSNYQQQSVFPKTGIDPGANGSNNQQVDSSYLPDMSGKAQQRDASAFEPQADWYVKQQAMLLPGNPDPAATMDELAVRNANSFNIDFHLKNGTRLFFSGMKVYFKDKKGRLRPLKDGRYTLQNGQPLVIRDGMRTNN